MSRRKEKTVKDVFWAAGYEIDDEEEKDVKKVLMNFAIAGHPTSAEQLVNLLTMFDDDKYQAAVEAAQQLGRDIEYRRVSG